MNWKPLADLASALKRPRPGATGVPWNEPAMLRRCDPYLVWSDLTAGAATQIPGASRVFTLLVELAPGALPTDVPDLKLNHDHYRDRLLSFLTGTTTAEGLRRLVRQVSGQTTGQKVVRLQVMRRVDLESELLIQGFLANAQAGAAAPAAAQALPPSIGPDAGLLSHKVTKALFLVDFSRPGPAPKAHFMKSETGEPPVRVCVIDDRCNFASMRLRGRDGSRVHSIWHQGIFPADESGYGKWIRPKVGEPGPRYGRRLIVTPAVSPSLRPGGSPPDETRQYAIANYLSSRVRLRWSHGAAVLDVIAADHFRLGTENLPMASPAQAVRFVQLPSSIVLDTSGASLASYALDGMHEALHSANPGQPVIVNLSYGTHSGPHDGSSMFERALAELIDTYNGSDRNRPGPLHVVLPAGNTQRARTHASGKLWPGEIAALYWKVLPDDPTDSFMEIWFDDPDGIEVSIRAPDDPADGSQDCNLQPGDAFRRSSPGREWGAPFAPGEEVVSAAAIFPREVAQGTCGSMLLLALAPTQRVDVQPGPPSVQRVRPSFIRFSGNTGAPRRTLQAPPGVWLVTLKSRHPRRFDAWIQRDDAAPGRGPESRGYRGRQSSFLDIKPGQVDPRVTLNGIATLRPRTPDRLWVVGAMRRDDLSLSAYSAAGPTRAEASGPPGIDATRFDGPEIVTLADDSLNLPGLLVGGVLSGARVRVSGTSIAAALFTRQLHHVLATSKGPGPVTLGDLIGWAAVGRPSRPTKVAAGAPEVADPLFRGERMRMPLLPALLSRARLPVREGIALPEPTQAATSAPAAPSPAAPAPGR